MREEKIIRENKIVEHAIAALVEEGILYQDDIAWLEDVIEAGRLARLNNDPH